jgi:iron complex outermembrane receptor protein
LTFDATYIRTERFIEQFASYALGTTGGATVFNTLNASPVLNPSPFATPPATQNRLYVGELPVNPAIGVGETRGPGLIIDPRSYGLRGPTDVVSAKVEWAPEGPWSAMYQFGFTRAKVTQRGNAMRDPTKPITIFGLTGTLFDSSGSDSSFKGYSNEVRFTYDNGGAFRMFFGVNYSKTSDIDSNLSEVAPTNSLTLPDPGIYFPIGAGLPFPAVSLRNTYVKRDEDIFSGFAFVSYKATDKLEITLEGRFTIEDQSLTDFLVRQAAPNNLIQSANPPRLSGSTNFFTPRGSITYRVSDDNILYASVARGVKSGGFNGVVNFIPQRTYAPETNWTYEIGSKNQFFDRALTVNVAAYHTSWRSLQTNAVRLRADGTADTAFIVPTVIGNIGGVNVWGGEVAMTWRVNKMITLDGGASYNSSKYTNDTVSQRFGASGNCDGIVCVTVPGTPTRVLPIGGNDVERRPTFDSFAGLTFTGEYGDNNSWFARGDFTYQTKQYVDEGNLAETPSRLLFNAGIGTTFGMFSVNAWVKNIADKQYVSSSLFLIGTGGAYSASYVPTLGDRRTFGLTGAVKF